jgi:hypothetical protein
MYGIGYTFSEESVDQLMGRLTPTFQAAFEVQLDGLKAMISSNKNGVERG